MQTTVIMTRALKGKSSVQEVTIFNPELVAKIDDFECESVFGAAATNLARSGDDQKIDSVMKPVSLTFVL